MDRRLDSLLVCALINAQNCTAPALHILHTFFELELRSSRVPIERRASCRVAEKNPVSKVLKDVI